MNTTKKIEYKKGIRSGIHTLSGRCSDAKMEQLQAEAAVKTCYRIKSKTDPEKTDIYMQLNVNKAGNHEIIPSWQQFRNRLTDLLDRCDVQQLSISRVDWCLDLLQPESFNKYYKLHRLFISCFAAEIGSKNNYFSQDLWTKSGLSLAVKTNKCEIEIYDKCRESGGKSEASCRIELRSKIMPGFDPEAFVTEWIDRLNRLQQQYKSVQQRYNDELLQKWNTDQKQSRKNRTYTSRTSFILQYSDCIFTRHQLVDLLEKMGSDNPVKAAKKIKDTYEIEFFSMEDLQIIVSEIIKNLQKYFEN